MKHEIFFYSDSANNRPISRFHENIVSTKTHKYLITMRENKAKKNIDRRFHPNRRARV